MMTILTVVQVLIALAMIGIILVQRGPGAAAGSGFGAGASATVFGSRGSSSFLTRSTAILATGFFVVSMVMAVIVSRTTQTGQDLDLGVMGGSQPAATEVSDVPSMTPAEGETQTGEVPTINEETEVPPVPDTESDDD